MECPSCGNPDCYYAGVADGVEVEVRVGQPQITGEVYGFDCDECGECFYALADGHVVGRC